MSFSCTSSVWKVSLFSCCAIKKLQQLPRRRTATFQTSSLRRTSNISTQTCLFPTRSHTELNANTARGCPRRFQCLHTAVFVTDSGTGTKGPQILTHPTAGPNALRMADCTTSKAYAHKQIPILNGTTNKRVTIIILMLILINKNVKQHSCSYGKISFQL